MLVADDAGDRLNNSGPNPEGESAEDATACRGRSRCYCRGIARRLILVESPRRIHRLRGVAVEVIDRRNNSPDPKGEPAKDQPLPAGETNKNPRALTARLQRF